MFIPSEACVDLTAETAHRIHYGNLFVAFSEMDSIAHHQLGVSLGIHTSEEAFENIPEADQLRLRNMSLARAYIFFAHDESENLRAVPWIRSPQDSKFSGHLRIANEFKDFALGAHEGLELNRPLDCFPDGLGGIVIPSEDQNDKEGQLTFAGRNKFALSEEYVHSIKVSQQILAEHGIELNVQAGEAVLPANER